MGDPKKQRKRYATPRHPWEKKRIEEERLLISDYGLKNKTEIWRMNSILRRLSNRAKELIGIHSEQSEKEKQQLLNTVYQMGLIAENAKIEDVLEISLRKIMDRRLQTMLQKKAMAKTVKQARQFITHGHVKIGGNKITFPSYIVKMGEEEKIKFVENSALANESHPERLMNEAKTSGEVKK